MSTAAVRIEAAPTPVEINFHNTAFLVVDMQNDLVTEGGLLHRLGVDISIFQTAVASTARALIAARAAGIPVVYLKMGLDADESDGPVDESVNRVKRLFGRAGAPVRLPEDVENRLLTPDTWNTDIVRDLAPWPEDQIIYHHRFSGFFETTLHDTLRRLGAKHLIVAGCTTSVGVESTIRDATSHDYSCVLLADCTAEPIGHGLPRSNHDATLLLVERLLGAVSTSEAFVKSLRRSYADWVAGDLQLR
jgi:ureidoacrylate peracid hydrolase